jgi:hypothetical protein
MNFLNKTITTLFICSTITTITSPPKTMTSTTESLSTSQVIPGLPYPLVVNVHSSNNSPGSNVLTANLESTQSPTHTHTHITKIDWPAFNWPQLQMSSILTSTQDRLKEHYDNLWSYKWHGLAGLTFASYLCLNAKIYSINKLLENPKSWCLWKEEIPLNRLTTIDAAELLKQLKIDAYKKYFNATEAIKDSELLVKFLEDVTREKNLLEFYQSVYSFSNALYVSRLFAINKTTEQIAQYIARLNFLMDLYLETHIQTNSNFNEARTA